MMLLISVIRRYKVSSRPVASYVGRKSEVRKRRQRDLQGFRLFCYQFVEY